MGAVRNGLLVDQPGEVAAQVDEFEQDRAQMVCVVGLGGWLGAGRRGCDMAARFRRAGGLPQEEWEVGGV